MALLLVIITMLWLARVPLLISVANHYLEPRNLSLTCLDFHLESLDDVVIEHLCLNTPDARVAVTDAHWAGSANKLKIKTVSVDHTPQAGSASPTDQPLRWDIPELPQIDIDSLHLNSPLLKHKLTFSLQYRQPQLNVQGPVMLAATLENNLLRGSLSWRPRDLGTFIDLPETLDPALLDSPIQSDWRFDGQHLSSEHQLALNQVFTLPKTETADACTLALTAQGRLSIDLNLLGSDVSLDASALPVNANVQQCAHRLPELPVPGSLELIQIRIPEPVRLSKKQLHIPVLRISSDSPLEAVIELNGIESDFSHLSTNYQLSGNLNSAKFSGGGHVSLSELSGISNMDAQAISQRLNLSASSYHLYMPKWQHEQVSLNDLNLDLDAEWKADTGLHAVLKVTAEGIQEQTRLGKKLQLTFNVTAKDIDRAEGTLQANIKEFSQDNVRIQGIKHQSQWRYADQQLSLTGNTSAQSVRALTVDISQPQLMHQGQMSVSKDTLATLPESLKSAHTLTLPSGFNGELTQQGQTIWLNIPSQPYKRLSAPLKKALPKFLPGSGEFSANLSYRLDTGKTQAQVNLSDIDFGYATYLVEGVNAKVNVQADSGQLQIAPTTLSIDRVDTGIDVRDIRARIASDNDTVFMQEINGKVFDGQFTIDKVELTDASQTSVLSLNNLDMARILALQQETGIDVQGRISGKIPLKIEHRQVEVSNGTLFNLNKGQLRITDNAAFASLKQTQPQLAPVLSLLQNLEFNQLKSDVSMDKEGLVNLKMQIKGHNPDKKQDVNFNYSHEENVYTLLRALRLGDEIQDKLEQGIK
ncbi:YdbH domain-containing protein [Lacimicrobium sp. SS2-24]|uniref:intermembrane phospholipid transport protein YdbH family protein n=1 Tax=Lacimicrobium sp. SS2-24 TaxID=2005569 RepID=UPI000B4B3CC3|nr:YdbH domain-containing protein [Lacimicrobium sp. SS2-24]